jgi:predicted hotdog family 3-hydroxylacyl-ACP dehydratase
VDFSRLPIEEILPHRGGMLLLDGVISHSPAGISVGATPRPSAWYADDAGMPGWVGIELMAQAIAAHVCLRYRSEGKPPRPGVLLGTRKYRNTLGCFPFGQRLAIGAAPSFQDDSGVGAYRCRIELAGREVADATVMVYEPENFGAFLRQATRAA